MPKQAFERVRVWTDPFLNHRSLSCPFSAFLRPLKASSQCRSHSCGPFHSPEIPSTQQHQNHTITPQEHLADEPVLVHWAALLAIRQSWNFRPHLLDVLQNHVAVSVEGFDAREHFAVVAAGNQDLRMVAHGGLEERQRTRSEFVGFEEADLIFAVI